MDGLEELAMYDTPLFNTAGFAELLLRFLFNSLIVLVIIHFFYYRKSRRCDYYFTFLLISVSIFLMIFLLGSVKLKIGFALGLFAIFGIIRYRTESMPVREMTYLFVIIAISVINALAVQLSIVELLATNMLFIICLLLGENIHRLTHISCKLVLYDRIDLITPERRQELLDDLAQRTGLTITKVEIGYVDFLKDATMLKVYYLSDDTTDNTVERQISLPKSEELL